ncbi:hypothetical protein TruAng_002926 [Truncatella angustata]|nr:hypothetical protein TruAng_002926 [Truncatella angustata]
MARVRYSLQELQAQYNGGNLAPLEKVIRAFKGIQSLPWGDKNSFFLIGGYHGEPFHDPDWPGPAPDTYWGGYCNHYNVLFPTWHRAYMLRLENAMRAIAGCEDVTLPFWDECLDYNTDTPIPAVLTSPTFVLDGEVINNPLYSYTLPQQLNDATGQDNRYTKHIGYETVRFPLSGLVGTEIDRVQTELHNSKFKDPASNTVILNTNVKNWLSGEVVIPDDDPKNPTPKPDIFSVFSLFKQCLNAPNYTVFSNKQSATQWVIDSGSKDKYFVVSLEQPHNSIHLALGGFYQKGVYDADPILGANGDIAENNTDGLDPIFFMHHCYIDYAFWTWQKKWGKTAKGSLDVISGYPGTNSSDPMTSPTPNIPPNTDLTPQTPLAPFSKDDGTYYTSDDVTDIENDLGYTYGRGSLDPVLSAPEAMAPDPAIEQPERLIQATGINRAQYPGSFVVRTYAKLPSGQKIEIGREAILSRWDVKRCANCQVSLPVEALTPLTGPLIEILRSRGVDIDKDFKVEVHSHHDYHLTAPLIGDGDGPGFLVI